MQSLDTEKLSSHVKAKREKLNLSLRQAGEASGVPHNSIHRIEDGKIPDVNNLIRVLSWLKSSLSKFIKED